MASAFDPDALLCPLCFETPLSDIYQCINGHTICSNCKASLEDCPQCRIPFANGLVRNRALETLLDSMKLSCPFSKQGCKGKVTRTDYKTHTLVCEFNPSSLKLCNQLGTTCQFVSNSENFRGMMDHFAQFHKFELLPSTKVDLTLNRFLETVNQYCIKKFQTGGALIWRPFLLSFPHKETFFLVISILRGTLLTWCCLILGNTKDANLYDVEFSIKGSGNNQSIGKFDLCWKTKPLTLEQVNLLGIQNFPLRLQVDNSFKLKFVSKNDKLLVKIFIKKAEQVNQPNDGVAEAQDDTANHNAEPSEWVFKENPNVVVPPSTRRMSTVEVIKNAIFGRK